MITAPKLMIIIAVFFLLFGVPSMAAWTILVKRKQRREPPDGRDSTVDGDR